MLRSGYKPTSATLGSMACYGRHSVRTVRTPSPRRSDCQSERLKLPVRTVRTLRLPVCPCPSTYYNPHKNVLCRTSFNYGNSFPEKQINDTFAYHLRIFAYHLRLFALYLRIFALYLRIFAFYQYLQCIKKPQRIFAVS